MRLATRQQWLSYLVALRFAAVLGGVFGLVAGAVMLKPPLTGALAGMVSGVVDFTTGMAFIGASEIFLPRTRLGRELARLPFFASVLIKAAAYLLVVLVVVGERLGPRMVGLVAGPEVALQIAAQIDAAFPPPRHKHPHFQTCVTATATKSLPPNCLSALQPRNAAVF